MRMNSFFSNKYVNILHQNIAGLINKSDDLLICLDELSKKYINIDILCITEHFIMEGYQNLLYLPNYNLAAMFCRNEKKRGGSCILIKNGIQWKELPKVAKLSIPGMFECCGVELTSYKIIIVCVYRIPNTNNLNHCFDRLETLLQELLHTHCKNIIICGDFNIDVLKPNNVTNAFECLLMSYNLQLALKQPTRMASLSCIDNFAHNVKACKTEVAELALSDHTAQILKCPVQKTCCLKYWYTKRRDYSVENILKFKNHLKSLTFSEVYSTDDPNVAYNNFIETFKLLYELCFPMTYLKINTIRKTKWLSKGIKICSKKKRKLLWQYRLNRNKSDKTRLAIYSKVYKKIINLTQKAQNNYSIKTSKNKSKTAWQIINRAKFNVPRANINKIKVNNDVISNPEAIAEAFNNFFIDKIQPKLPANSRPKTATLAFNNKSMFMAPSIPYDIKKIIMSLNSTNSVGYDGIATKILKHVSDEICGHLSHIINLSISEGVFPDALKVAIVRPLFKKDDREIMEHYRPISLIPIIAKVFEKYIYKELYTFIEKNKFLCEEQKGFRLGKTVNMAIYDFLYNVAKNVDKRKPICGLFCDMTQAFDYVHYGTLLNKLESYGIRGNINNLIKSYLQNRTQITEINKIDMKSKHDIVYQSTERKISFGVPQGSVLGPLLFILYINDLPKCIPQHLTLFADDSTLTIPCNKPETYENDINESINQIVKWLDNNNLKINLLKTKRIHFSQRINDKSNLNIFYDNQAVEEVDTTKFLGLRIDKKLNWKPHIDFLCKKLSKSAYALHTLSCIIGVEALLTAYYGLAESHLRYGVMFWGNSTERETVFKAQKRCIRSSFKLKPTDSCVPFFKKYAILTLPCIYILEIAVFVKSNPDRFKRLDDVVPRNRRDNSRVCLHSAGTALMRKSVFCMAPIIYNKCPKAWKELPLLLFKKTLRKFLAYKAYYSINDFFNEMDFTLPSRHT